MDDISNKLSQLSPKVKATQARELAARAERIKDAIALLQSEIQQLESEGNIAPTDTWVMRYKARSQKGYYWYYKLQAFLGNLSPSYR